MKNKIFLLTIVALCIILMITLLNKDDINTNDVNQIDTKIDIDINEEGNKFDGYENQILKSTGENISITEGGIYTLSGNITGSVIINTQDNIKLILDNAAINSNNGPAIYIENANNTFIELIGTNTLIDSNNYSNYTDVDGCIFSSDDLIFSGEGTLKINSNYLDAIVSKDDLKFTSGIYIIESNDDGIRGKDSIIIENGTFAINSKGDGIKSTNDTDTEKGYILIENGNIQIESDTDALQAENKLIINGGNFVLKTGGSASNSSTSNNGIWGNWQKNSKNSSSQSAKALKAVSNISITDGTFLINSSDDAIHSNDSISITSGTFNIASGDDGIHADTLLIIDGGKIDITKSYEGLESSNVTINNGDISIIASDDGINVAGGNDSSGMMSRPGQNYFTTTSNCKLTINNGNIYIDSSGDGLDANGSIIMNGGLTIVNGPINDGNGALDYDSSFEANNGTLLAAGSSGMAQGTTSGEIYSVLINFEQYLSANTIVNIDEIITFAPSKKFNSLLIVSPNFKKGEKYTVNYGGSTTGTSNNGLYTDGIYSSGTIYKEFMITNISTSIGSKNNGMNGMGMPGNMRR